MLGLCSFKRIQDVHEKLVLRGPREVDKIVPGKGNTQKSCYLLSSAYLIFQIRQSIFFWGHICVTNYVLDLCNFLVTVLALE